MITITKDNFSIKQICESGQCFRLELLEEREEAEEDGGRRGGGPDPGGVSDLPEDMTAHLPERKDKQ